MTQPGIVISIMVDNAKHTVGLIKAHGGKVLVEQQLDSGEIVVSFSDPAGNVMGLYQQN